MACDSCWDQAVNFPEREPEKPSVDAAVQQMVQPVADPREGTPATCKECGGQGSWHRTLNGKWLIMEPGMYPLPKIPRGKRWRIAGDGTAVNLRSSSPTDECRITHFDVCPCKPAPTDAPLLLAVWKQRRAEVVFVEDDGDE